MIKMRIAVLTNEYPPGVTGGAGRIACLYNQLLEKHGYEIKIWNMGQEFNLWREKNIFYRLFHHLKDLRANGLIAREIIDWKPALLLTHNLTGCGFGTPKRIRSLSIRWIHFLHDVQLFEPSGQILFNESYGYIRRLWRKVWSVLRRQAMGSPDAIASPTKWLLEEHFKYGFFKNIRTKIIPNPLIVLPVMDDSLIRDPRQVLFVGRLDRDKGLAVLLEAFENLSKVASRLVVIGDGRMMKKLKEIKRPTIEVRGSQSSLQVYKAMCQSGVVVVPSVIMENQPTVILEALAYSCRVVASDLGGVRETLGQAGWLFAPGSAESLSDAMTAALNEPIEKFRANKRDELLVRHDPETSVLSLMGLFKSNL